MAEYLISFINKSLYSESSTLCWTYRYSRLCYMRSCHMQYINCLWYSTAILTYILPSATANFIGFVNTSYMFRPQTLIYTTYKRKIKSILPAWWLRIGTGGGHLWMGWWTFEFHKMMGNFLTSWETVSFSRWTVLHGVSEYILNYLLT